jgi:hypothetical protein
MRIGKALTLTKDPKQTSDLNTLQERDTSDNCYTAENISLYLSRKNESTTFYGLGKEYFSQFKDPPVFDSTKVANTYAERNCSWERSAAAVRRPSCTFSQ